MTRVFNRLVTVGVAALLLLGFGNSIKAQGQYYNQFVISSKEGANSSQSFFTENAIMYMYIFTKNLNVMNMEKAKWEITKEDGNEYQFQGQFKNHFNGTFSAQFNLSNLPEAGQWKWKAKLEDEDGHEVEFEKEFTYMSNSSDLEQDMKMEMEGYVQAKGKDSLVVNNLVFYVNKDTKIKNENGPAHFEDIQIGNFVEIKARVQDSSKFVALKIKIKNEDDSDAREIEVKGRINTVTDSSIVVNGQMFMVNAQTEIEGRHDEHLTLSDLKEGMFVKVKAQLQFNFKFIALKIEVEGSFEMNEVEFWGIIDSVGSDYIVMVNHRIQVTDQTEIEVNDDDDATIADLQPGMRAEIKAQITETGELIALEIEVKNAQYVFQKIEIIGAIDSLGNNFIMVQGYVIVANMNTVILDASFQPITLADLQKGQIVKVKGFVQNDGTVLAYRIKIKDLWTAYLKVEGAIEAIGEHSVTVQGMVFNVDSATVILDDNSRLITLADLSEGQMVHIKALEQEDGSYLALRIKLKDEPQATIDITGAIQAITSDSLTVNDVRFYVSGKTEIYDMQDQLITLNDLQVGLVVEVKGSILGDGTYCAGKIEVEEDPNMVSLNSALSGKSDASIYIAGTEYRITPNTVVLDSTYNEISVDDLALGEDVTVWALPTDDGNMEAVQVQSSTSSALTTVNNSSPTVVKSFTLKQNYPNPFNPVTTIEFVINQSRFANVRLEVYNILGQKVRTLYNGVLDAGTYKFQWNGLNDASQQVASGMYLYRLEVNGRAQIKQMVLLK